MNHYVYWKKQVQFHWDQFLNEQSKTGNNEFDGLKQQLEKYGKSLLTHKQEIIKKIDNILQMITEQIKLIQPQQENYQNKFKQKVSEIQQIKDFEKELNQIQQRKKQVLQDLEQQLKQLQEQFNYIGDTVEMLKYTPKQIEYETFIVSNKTASQEENNKEKEFEYELISELIKSEKNSCQAFAFNNDNTILLVGCQSSIICYDLQNWKIYKELQRLKNTDDEEVEFLHLMKQSKEFVSGSNKSLIIWSINENNQWFSKQEIQGQSNNNNDLIIYLQTITDSEFDEQCVVESQIIFLRKIKDSWSCQQIINTNEYFKQLSLNEEGNKLITCEHYNQIFVIELQNDQNWIIVQKIEGIEQGFGLCFTIGNQFVHKPQTLDYLEVYDYDKIQKKFLKIAQVLVQKSEDQAQQFPCQFIRQLNILIAKHGKFLNIFKVNKNGIYQLMQSIQYESQSSLYGTASEDGQYLVTWDNGPKQIQMRKLKLKFN